MNRIPVYLLTGFLGSGKTTVLKRMLQALKKQGKQPALIMNELGSENVEKEQFEDESMIELLNGCICCTIQDDMRNELSKFLELNNRVDVLLIEGTGIANPAEIVEVLTHPDIIDQVTIESIIGMIDASRYLEYQSLFQSSKEIRTMLKQQVTSSTLLVVNKTDAIDQKKLKKVTTKIEEIKMKNTPIVFAEYGDVPLDMLFEKRFKTDTIHVQPGKQTEHHHHHHHYDHHSFQAIKLEGIEALDQDSFKKWLKSQGPELLRAKGYIVFQEDSQVFSFQYASNQLELQPIETNKGTCIILIGTRLNQDQIEQTFQEFVRQIV
ncbi:GTP-binding protein [Alkalihalobacillus sp. MEB130]|uniref:CobW family GTP-binding protein n=1 Tax=Alkalihalobacillus sp. MEB130 TaxID=2976704 RepID=UPI0028E0908E|nr:GTP-binding protein [Alkalihalobacillus sp. MEB130]MDT8859847.1 GTP-binding protein [Alkalihalobacillus sp. MEB130]